MMAPSYTNEYLTVPEVAELLRISKSAVYRLVERRVVRFYKIPSGLRFKRVDLDDFLESCCLDAIK